VTGGADIPVALVISMLAGAVVGYITFLGQKKWSGDDYESAKIKGLITGIDSHSYRAAGHVVWVGCLAGLLLRKKSGGGWHDVRKRSRHPLLRLSPMIIFLCGTPVLAYMRSTDWRGKTSGAKVLAERTCVRGSVAWSLQ